MANHTKAIDMEPHHQASSSDPLKKWTPEPSLLNHSGQPLRQDSVFFVAPPSQIGQLRSVDSSLRARARPLPILLRTAICMVSVFLCVFLLEAASGFPSWRDQSAQFAILFIGTSIGAGLSVLIWRATNFRHECSFVGTNGLALCILNRSQDTIPIVHTLEFHTTSILLASEVKRYRSHVFMGSKYSFQWLSGNEAFTLSGNYYFSRARPIGSIRYHLGRQAERAWSDFQWPRVLNSLEKLGHVEFSLEADKRIRISRDSISFKIGDREWVTFPCDQILLQVFNGRISLRTRSKGTLGRRWRAFTGYYAEIPNAQLLIHALTRIARLKSN